MEFNRVHFLTKVYNSIIWKVNKIMTIRKKLGLKFLIIQYKLLTFY